MKTKISDSTSEPPSGGATLVDSCQERPCGFVGGHDGVMNVGLTYDLRSEYLAMGYGEVDTAEFDRDDTIESIERAVAALGHRTDRIGHVRQLAERLVNGDRWDLVFNIAEGVSGIGREAQIPALLDAYGVPYTFSDPLVSALTLHKGMTKSVLRDLGIPTTEFAVVEDLGDLSRIRFGYPMFVKPVGEGTAKGIDAGSKVHSRAQLVRRCQATLDEHRQPVLVEPYLAGREFTTSLIGTGDHARVVGTLEIRLLDGAEPDAYTYVNKERCEDLVEYTRVRGEWARRCARLALRTWRALGCRDAGRVDLRCDDFGVLQVLEVNPLPGLHPEHSDLPMTCTAMGVSYDDLIRDIVASASQRVAREVSVGGLESAA
mgnify:CR=1 FL=1